MSRRRRIDAQVDAINWQDDGCPDGRIPSCLDCPLSQCRYDVQGGIPAIERMERNRRIIALSRTHSAVQIAEVIGTSKRTVWRALEKGRV